MDGFNFDTLFKGVETAINGYATIVAAKAGTVIPRQTTSAPPPPAPVPWGLIVIAGIGVVVVLGGLAIFTR